MSLDDFYIQKELGSGSFGSVFKAQKKSDKLIYAIKQVNLATLSARERENALNEVRLLASISSPFIVCYREAFVDEIRKKLCIVMEFAEEGDLAKMIENHKKQHTRFPEAFIWKCANDILSGTLKLHENKIIHRDIKAANIFFGEGTAKLGDLNVSRVVANGQMARTQTGTPYYTSPQIWQNKPYGPKCDIWSIGCVLYEMCMLRPPFEATSYDGLYKKIKAGVINKINGYSSELENMIRSCLTLDDKRRPNATQLLMNQNFSSFRQKNEVKFAERKDSINLLQTIHMPKVIRFLKDKLPTAMYGEEFQKKKKQLASHQLIEDQTEEEGTYKPLRQYKSAKLLLAPSDQNKAPVNKSDVQVLPILKSDKKIGEGILPPVREQSVDVNKRPRKMSIERREIESFKPVQERRLPKINSTKYLEIQRNKKW